MRENRYPDELCYAHRLIQPFVLWFRDKFNALDPDTLIPKEFVDIALAIGGLFIGDPNFGRTALETIGPAEHTVSNFQSIADQFFELFKSLDQETRIPMALAHDLLDIAMTFFGDPDSGLKAGCSTSIGDIGVLGYAMSSAGTVYEAIEVAARYAHLVNDALDTRLEFEGQRAIIRLDSRLTLPRAAEDFQVSTFYNCHKDNLFRDIPNMEICFVHSEPEDTTEYSRTFKSIPVRFSAAYCGIMFDKDYLRAPLRSANLKLHSATRKYADLVLAQLASPGNMTERTRQFIAEKLPYGQPSIEALAQRLNISSRTLARRLELEGTTYRDLLDDLRKHLASQYVLDPGISLAEVTFLLGYSRRTTFYRAFRRWTGKTPLEFRKQHNK